MDGLLECSIVIICDGCEQVKIGETENNKHGKASADTVSRYREHIERLRDTVSARDPPFVPEAEGSIELLELERRHGSACAISAAFSTHDKVKTPYVMICQHDNFFIQGAPLRSCLHALQACPGLGIGLKCLHFMSTATMDYATKVRKRYSLELEPQKVNGIEGDLLPLAFWYGRSHVAYSDYYRTFVLNRPLQAGDHLEELLGVTQLNDVCKRGAEAANEHGTYVLDQGCGEVIYHLSGRRVRAAKTSPADDAAGRHVLEKVSDTRTSSRKDGAASGENGSFTSAQSFCAVVPGLEIISEKPRQGTPPRGRFKQKCFHCGTKGHSFKFCPEMNTAPATKIIDLS